MMSFDGAPRELPAPDPSPAGLLRFPKGEAPRGYFFPTAVVDGVLLSEPPLEALQRGVAAHLDIIVGGNRDEDAAKPPAAEGWWPDNYGLRLRETEGRHEVVHRMAWEVAGMPRLLQASPQHILARVEALVTAYDAEREADVFGLGLCGNATSEEQWLHDSMASDFSFLAAVLLIAERLALPGCSRRVFRYQFNGYGGRGDAFHAAELPLLLGEDSALRFGSQQVRSEWIGSWLAFARTGDPNTPSMAGAWRPYDNHDRPVLFWDGLQGWRADGGREMARRTALRETARLWEELWDLGRVC